VLSSQSFDDAQIDGTRVHIVPVPWELACQLWTVQDWREWPAPAPSFHWHFREELSVYIKAGHGVVRAVGPCGSHVPHVVAEGDLLLLPGGFRATWDAGEGLVLAWRTRHVELTRDLTEQASGMPTGEGAGSAASQLGTGVWLEDAANLVEAAPPLEQQRDCPTEGASLGGAAGEVVADDVIIALPDAERLGETRAEVERIVYKSCKCTCFCACGASASFAAVADDPDNAGSSVGSPYATASSAASLLMCLCFNSFLLTGSTLLLH
jgi:hypothetical protein